MKMNGKFRALWICMLIVFSLFALQTAAVGTGQAACTELNGAGNIAEPGCYEMGSSVTNSSNEVVIRIRASNVELDGNGNVIDGVNNETVGQAAVLVDGEPGSRLSNVTVRNFSVLADFENNIVYDNADNGAIEGLRTQTAPVSGITVFNSTGTQISGVHARLNGYGNDSGGIKLIEASGTEITDTNSSANFGSGVWNFESNGTEIQNVTADDNTEAGIELVASNSVTINNSTLSDNDRGVRLEDARQSQPATGIRIIDPAGDGNTWPFEHVAYSRPPSNNSILNPDTGESIWPSNSRYRENSSPPTPPDGYETTGNALDLERVTNDFGGLLNFTITYEDDDITGVNESTLGLWYYNGSGWDNVSAAAVESSTNTVTANLSRSGTYALLGEADSGEADGGGAVAQPDIAVDRGELEYGNIRVSENSSATVTVQNSGDATLIITDITLSGDSSSAFSASETSLSLDPGDSQDVAVTFAPSTGTNYSVNLEIESNDPDKPTSTVSVSGTGISGDISPTNDTLGFGETIVSTQTERALPVENAGSGSLDIQNVSVRGSDAGQFSVTDSPDMITAGESRKITVGYTPTREGTANATLEIESDDPDDSVTEIPLEGQGTQSAFEVSPGSHDYGVVAAGIVENMSFTAENNGTAVATVTGWQLAGANPDSFQLLGDSNGATLDEGEQTNVTVAFAPESNRNRTARLQLLNTTGTPVYEVGLAGRGEAPEIALGNKSLSYTEATVGERVIKNISVRNAGADDLQISNQTVQPSDNEFEILTAVNGTLEPGQSDSLTVAFQPDSESAKSAVLSMTTNDPTRETTVIYLSSSRATANVSLNRSKNVTDVSATVENATAGESVAITVPSESEDTTDIDQVSVTPRVNGSFGLDVNSTSERPVSASAFEPNESTEPSELGYMNISHSISNDNISQASVSYRVSREEMAALESEPDDFSMYRQYNGTLERVNTTLEGETNDSYVFQSTAPGLSEWTAATEVPRISVTDATANVTTVTTREAINIQVLLNNTGGSDGRFEVRLLLDGEVVEERDVAVAPTTTSLVSFERDFGQPGNYSVTVNDIFVASVDVSETSEEARVVNDTPDGPSSPSNAFGPLSPGLAVLAIILTVVFANRFLTGRE